MQEAPTLDWAAFTQHFVRDLGPPIDQETIGDLAPLRHTGTVHDYVIIFTAYGLYVDIASKLHQARTNLDSVTKHRPKEMVPAVSLADNQEHQETTTAASASDISNTNASTNPNLVHAQQRVRAAPPGKMAHASAPLSLVADPASYVSPPMPLPPHIDNKIGAPPASTSLSTPSKPSLTSTPTPTTQLSGMLTPHRVR
jgi:hypothetical protein